MEREPPPFPGWEALSPNPSPARPSRRWVKRTWQQIRAPQSELSHWLGQNHVRFSRRLARDLKIYDLIASEWAALRYMYNPGRTSPLALARALGMTKGGASKLIARLVGKGLVDKEVTRPDRRGRSVGLTRAGKRLVPCLAGLAEDAEHGLFSKLTAHQQHGLMHALKVIADAAHKRYLDTWVSTSGCGGQWAFERAGWAGH